MDVDFKKQAVEAFNTIQTNIGFLGIDHDIKKIMITSSIKGEGKSIVSTNVANSYAFAKKRVLLIDCDMRNPIVHRVLGLPNRKGLAELIMANKQDQETEDYRIRRNAYFDVLTAGHRPPNPTELLGSKKMEALINTFAEQYDYVILDTPPVLLVPDAIALHKYADGILLVVRHGYTTKEVLEDSKKTWEVAGTKPTACILNAIPDMQKRYSYYGYYDYVENPESKKGGKEKKRSRRDAGYDDANAPIDKAAQNAYQPKTEEVKHIQDEEEYNGTMTSFKGSYGDRRMKRKIR